MHFVYPTLPLHFLHDNDQLSAHREIFAKPTVIKINKSINQSHRLNNIISFKINNATNMKDSRATDCTLEQFIFGTEFTTLENDVVKI